VKAGIAQSDMQTAHQDSRFPQRWRKGQSGNRDGLSRTERRYREFLALYIETHHRKPNAVENAMLRNAGECAARAEDKRRAKVEHIVRCGRLLQQLLDKLGLASTPAPGAPKTGLEKLHEALDRMGRKP
jgi:hypothetical protein